MTRKQELMLIELGLQTLLDNYKKPKKAKVNHEHKEPEKKQHPLVGTKWTEARRKKFKATMKKLWEDKQKLKTSPK